MSKRTNTNPRAIIEIAQPTQPQVQEYNLDDLMKEHKTKSSVIRFLTSKGWDRSKVAKFMGIRYQHVRNVLTQPLKQDKQ